LPGSPLLEIGHVVRPHGLSGEVVVDLVSNRPERLATGSVLDVGGRRLRVATARPFKTRWLVGFDGVDSADAAEHIRGVRIVAPAIHDPDALWVHDLVGAEVASVDATPLGRVCAVVSNPASDLLELEDGGLVPVCFVVEVRPGLLFVDAPPGLLD
jgi:16S rRNA processing protein RimM